MNPRKLNIPHEQIYIYSTHLLSLRKPQVKGGKGKFKSEVLLPYNSTPTLKNDPRMHWLVLSWVPYTNLATDQYNVYNHDGRAKITVFFQLATTFGGNTF